jgi:glyoxalase family protein
MSDSSIKGLHHVTAICGDPRVNHRFYTGTLGLRLVKRTVNFDDPGTYHLYYGDGAGTPGTILTFFPWVGAPRGRSGAGMAAATAFRTGESSLGWWKKRLEDAKVAVQGPLSRLGETYLALEDPDGLLLEIVAAGPSGVPGAWAASPVPPEHALLGFHTVTLSEADGVPTRTLVVSEMGFREVGSEGGRRRFQAPGAGPASYLDVVSAAGARAGSLGRGTVHHVAFRVPDDGAQETWRAALLKAGHHVSPVMDRSYFHSIYYREPGCVLFEIATDNPGFAVDEPAATLGEALMLPAQYEEDREKIAALLPPL